MTTSLEAKVLFEATALKILDLSALGLLLLDNIWCLKRGLKVFLR